MNSMGTGICSTLCMWLLSQQTKRGKLGKVRERGYLRLLPCYELSNINILKVSKDGD